MTADGAMAEIAERCRRLEGGGLRTFAEDPPFVWERAEGATIWDAAGRAYTDLYAGFAVAAVGHQHPKVVAAIREQAGMLMHCPSAHPSRVRAEFLEALASLAPKGLDRILPAISGAMANEVAIAIARTRKPGGEFITFSGSYFGRSAGTVGFAGKARYRQALGVPLQAHMVPYPYPLRMGERASDVAIDAIERLVGPGGGGGPIAAIILEPIQGNGGVLIPPADFLPRLRKLCDRLDALLIVDEIQSGCGRTGKMWALEHAGVTPDLMTIGKGIGGGLAVAAVLGRAEVMNWPADSFTSTFLTNNLNLAAASAAIGVLKEERLVERAARLGEAAGKRLRQSLGNLRSVAELRGMGLWFGIELTDRLGRPAAAQAKHAVKMLRDRGIVVGRGGHGDNVVKLSPPLVIEAGVMMEAIDEVAATIRETAD
ncbi:MAG TPA: aminotransferase class III-fold pyridoxal phosphate-dependent enzyme [Methylomirabilota bacterium]|nr:aminotransferase class III-fold pyridoxal phosphate-dependent enzyme [Methylomirabilota bacterium]